MILLPTQMNAFCSSQLRLEVIIIIATPVLPTPLRRITDEQVSRVRTQNETVLKEMIGNNVNLSDLIHFVESFLYRYI